MPPFIQNLLSLPGKTKALLGVSAFAILAIAFLLLRIATAPSYALIATGLDPAQTGKITAALDEQGIAYELRNNGTGLAVAKTATAQARIALATQGVQSSGGGAQPGNELLDQSKLGASQFQQQMTAQRALEGEVAKTLRGIEGVTNPRVQIVMPQDDLFADEASSATAAVMLGNPSDTLAPGAVRGMAQLTASAVKGLKSDNVTISDSTGQVLWPAGDGATGAGGGSTKASAEARYARQLESSVNALMDSTLGPNKARIKVNADLNVDKSTQEELTYAKKGTPMKTSAGDRAPRGRHGDHRRHGRHRREHPDLLRGRRGRERQLQLPADQEGHRLRRRQDDHQDREGAGHRQQAQRRADGRQVGPDRTSTTSLQSTVAAAAGIDTARGDKLQPMMMAFPKAEVPKAGPVPTTLLGPLKWVGLGLASLLFLFFMTRGMRKREGEALAPSWITQIEEPMSLAQLEARSGHGSISTAPPRRCSRRACRTAT